MDAGAVPRFCRRVAGKMYTFARHPGHRSFPARSKDVVSPGSAWREREGVGPAARVGQPPVGADREVRSRLNVRRDGDGRERLQRRRIRVACGGRGRGNDPARSHVQCVRGQRGRAPRRAIRRSVAAAVYGRAATAGVPPRYGTGSTCRPAFQTSKWRCGPLTSPVLPLSPTRSPTLTVLPAVTSISDRWA